MKKFCSFTVLLLISVYCFGQAPVIGDFSPISGPVGTFITITGSNFSPISSYNIVHFGSVKARVTNASSSELTVTLPPGTTYQPIAVTVNGRTAYSTKIFITTFGGGGAIDTSAFGDAISYTSGAGSRRIAIGDLDGDGKSDIVVGSYGGAISVFRNISTDSVISFAPAIDFKVGSIASDIAIGDLDSDGKLDLAATIESLHQVSVLRNISTPGAITTSSFEPALNFATSLLPHDVSVDDLDGDGKPDLIVATQHSQICVLRNTSTMGSLTTASFANSVNFTVGAETQTISTKDLDGDGKPELVTASSNGNTMSILKNMSTVGSITTGSFATKVDFATGVYPHATMIADLDGDSKPDIAVVNYYSSTVSVFKNVSDLGAITSGSFAAKVDFTTLPNPSSVAAADVNGDGKPDLCIGSPGGLSIFRNISMTGVLTTGSFASKIDVGTSVGGRAAVGDLNNDGKPDVSFATFANGKLSILTNALSYPIKQDQSIIFNALSNNITMGDIALTLDAIASSGLPVEFSTTSSNISIAGNQATLLMPGIVTITANQNGNDLYMAADSVSKTFCINPMKPQISVENSDILVSTSSSGNQWYYNGVAINGETSSSLRVTESGTYNVKVTVDDCASQLSDDFCLAVSGTGNASARQVVLYPVPAQRSISLEFNHGDDGGPIDILIYNTLLQLIMHKTAVGNQLKVDLDISHLPPGVYVLHTSKKNIKQQIKFVKEN
jgi:hypothetical protein